jgi:hypothetical protein
MAGTGAHALGLVAHAPSFFPVPGDDRSSSTASNLNPAGVGLLHNAP